MATQALSMRDALFAVQTPLANERGPRAANDNTSAQADADLWRRLIVLLTSFSEAAGVIGWQKRLQGGTAMEFCQEIIAAYSDRTAEAC